MKIFSKLIVYLGLYPFRTYLLMVMIFLTAFTEVVSLNILIPIMDFIQQGTDVIPTNKVIRFMMGFFEWFGIPFTLLNYLTFAFLLLTLQFVMKFGQSVSTGWLFHGVREKVRLDIFNNLMDTALSYFNNTKKGTFVDIMTTQVDRIGYALMRFVSIVSNSLLALGYFAFMVFVSFKLTLLLVCVGILKHFISNIFIRFSKKYGDSVLKASNRHSSTLIETFEGLYLIKSLSREKYEKERFKRIVKDLTRFQIKSIFNNSFLMLVDEGMTPLILCTIVFISIEKLHLSASYILVYLFAMQRIIPKLTAINSAREELAFNMASAEAIMDLKNPDNKPRIKTGNVKIKSLKEEIVFDKVSFSYEADHPVLNDISFRIKKGHTVAIIGASGSGKSSLINLMLNLYPASSGNILVDGVSINNLDLECWHQLIGVVNQDTFVFNETIYQNILYGNLQADRDQVLEASRRAYAAEFIEKLNEGYETIIGDRGIKLSGGQRQRISLARTFLRIPEILILDEATSQIDTISERMIQKALEELSGSRTVIIIAHRLSTIKNADKIIVLEHGQVVEEGNHNELLNNGTFYNKYYKMQSF